MTGVQTCALPIFPQGRVSGKGCLWLRATALRPTDSVGTACHCQSASAFGLPARCDSVPDPCTLSTSLLRKQRIETGWCCLARVLRCCLQSGRLVSAVGKLLWSAELRSFDVQRLSLYFVGPCHSQGGLTTAKRPRRAGFLYALTLSLICCHRHLEEDTPGCLVVSFALKLLVLE